MVSRKQSRKRQSAEPWRASARRKAPRADACGSDFFRLTQPTDMNPRRPKVPANSPGARPGFPVHAGTAEPLRVSPPEAVVYLDGIIKV